MRARGKQGPCKPTISDIVTVYGCTVLYRTGFAEGVAVLKTSLIGLRVGVLHDCHQIRPAVNVWVPADGEEIITSSGATRQREFANLFEGIGMAHQ